jgi:3-methyladenine DNA glycosylase AlkD
LEKIVSLLYENHDQAYKDFQGNLIPTISDETMIGVRTPVLRKLAKQIRKDPCCEEFLRDLPHKYFEENQLHGFIISEIRDFDKCIEEVELFLPYIDNWATCDQTSPVVFKKARKQLLPYIMKWLDSDHTFTVRFAIGMLMKHFLDEDFDRKYLETVAGIQSEEYYINLEISWYLATALAKQWEYAIPYIESRTLSKAVQNKTIQKACESYRITDEQKKYLTGLKE